MGSPYMGVGQDQAMETRELTISNYVGQNRDISTTGNET